MKPRWFVMALMLLAAELDPVAGQETKVTGDLALLQGTWSAVTVLPNGGKLRSKIEFRGDHVLGTAGHDKMPTSEYRVVVDENARPQTLDLVDGKAINLEPGSLLAKITPPDLFGIYELDGDTLRTATKPLSKIRPTTLARSREVMVTVYTRGEVAREESGVEPRKGMAPKLKLPSVEGDLLALQGAWTSGEGMFYGHGKETMTVQGDHIVVVAHGARGVELRLQARIKLDENADPKAIDFLEVKGGTKRQADGHGIYQLDGDVLKLHKSGQGHPRSSTFENGSEAGRVAIWTRGSIVVRGKSATRGQGGGGHAVAGGGQEFKGATVVSFSPRSVVLKTADGRNVEASLFGAKGVNIDGTPAGRGDALMKPGNVVDVTIIPVPTSKIGLQAIKEFRLVQVGDGTPAPEPEPPAGAAASAPAPAEETQGIEYRGAVIADVHTKRIVLSVDGKPVEIAPTDRKTRAFDSNGRQLTMVTQSWVIKKGNVVDIVIVPAPPPKKGRKQALPTIREIRLIQGTLKDVPRYLDASPANKP
jgi:uncharacterized protein (TIGR03067 family)